MRTWNDYKKTFSDPSLFDFARSGDLQGLMEILEENPGLDLNQKNYKGYSALMLAVYNGQDIFAEALLRGGADPNSSDLVGNTVLMGSCFKGNVELIKLLLSYGADLEMKNDVGMTAYDWAKTFGRKEVMNFLKERRPESGKENSLLKNYINFVRLAAKLVLAKRRG